jgi:hypothetical protein
MSKQQERDEQLAELWRVLTETHEPSHRARRKPGEEISHTTAKVEEKGREAEYRYHHECASQTDLSRGQGVEGRVGAAAIGLRGEQSPQSNGGTCYTRLKGYGL